MKLSDSPTTELDAAMAELRQAMMSSKERWLGQLGLTQSQIHALMWLASHGRQTTGDMAACLGVTPSAATQTLDTLVRRGLIEREPDPDDRRVMRHSLSTEGRHLTITIFDSRRRYFEELSHQLSAEELAVTIRSIRTFAKLLTAQSKNSPNQTTERTL